MITTWPGKDGMLENSEKVPTRIAYDANTSWGFIVDAEAEHYQEFKLGLEKTSLQHHATLADEFPAPNSLPYILRSPTQLSSDFLTKLREWLEVDVDKSMGEGTFAATKVEYVITVPAIWSEKAKNLTRLCAQQAGMGDRVKMISEPEAAMVHAMSKLPGGQIELGDCFILCDAGGGTVDLITYRIVGIDPLRIEELVAGDGDRCGSIFLDRQFRVHFQQLCKKLTKWTPQNTLTAVEFFVTTAKRMFDEKNSEVLLKVTNALDEKVGKLIVRKGKLLIPALDVLKMFEKVARLVLKLVEEQQRRFSQKQHKFKTKEAALSTTGDEDVLRLKAVILVGGFGQNHYLREYLKRSICKLGLELFLPEDGWTSIVRGALDRTLPILVPIARKVHVTSRISRRAYGIIESVPFNPIIDKGHESKRYMIPEL